MIQFQIPPLGLHILIYLALLYLLWQGLGVVHHLLMLYRMAALEEVEHLLQMELEDSLLLVVMEQMGEFLADLVKEDKLVEEGQVDGVEIQQGLLIAVMEEEHPPSHSNKHLGGIHHQDHPLMAHREEVGILEEEKGALLVEGALILILLLQSLHHIEETKCLQIFYQAMEEVNKMVM
jgi:hypothetical protein